MEQAKSAKEIIALLVAMVVLVALGVAQHLPGRLLSQQREDHAGKDDSLLAEGLDGWVGRWLGDHKDPGEPPD